VSGLFDHGPLLDGPAAVFFAEQRVVSVATSMPDGSPHVVPISPVLDLDRIVFATEGDTVKARNLRNDDRVCLSADAYDEDWSKLRSVVVFGRAQLIEAGFEWERARNLLYDKYPQYPSEAPIEEGSTLIVDVTLDRIVTWGF
jgi:nitroimidazol reductase NimA-like FMN-containing flavoprotein (pyridoxamine 5'-phosphate oxidase superfamily)